jgi:hypothetical protein
MLQNRVRAISGLDGSANGTCLYATIYWLYEDLHGVAPTAKLMSDIAFHCTFNRIFNDMIAVGSRVSRPIFGSLNLVPGSVLVFQKNGQPGHGCIVKSSTAIGGYNQTNWFRTPGITHRYSEHSPNDIVWRGATHPHDVNVNVVVPPFPPNPIWGTLYQVNQAQAKDVLFRNINGMPVA